MGLFVSGANTTVHVYKENVYSVVITAPFINNRATGIYTLQRFIFHCMSPCSVFSLIVFSVLCFWEDYKLYYDTTHQQQKWYCCPAVVSVVSPEIQSEDGSTWVIVDEVPLGENCNYTIHIVPRNATTGENSMATFPHIS